MTQSRLARSGEGTNLLIRFGRPARSLITLTKRNSKETGEVAGRIVRGNEKLQLLLVFFLCAAYHSLYNITEFGIFAGFLINSPRDAKLEVLTALLMTTFVF